MTSIRFDMRWVFKNDSKKISTWTLCDLDTGENENSAKKEAPGCSSWKMEYCVKQKSSFLSLSLLTMSYALLLFQFFQLH